jgi:uncharacterized membrane protein YfcA
MELWQQLLILCPLLAIAGLIDGISGGGGMIALPSYLMMGLPVTSAYACNKVQSCLGTSASMAKYAKSGMIDWKSAIPAAAAAIVGAALGSIGLIGAIALIIRRLLDPTVAMGWSSLMVTMLVCSGAIIMFLGLIGEYLGRLFMTMNKAPQYVVKEVLDDKADHDE